MKPSMVMMRRHRHSHRQQNSVIVAGGTGTALDPDPDPGPGPTLPVEHDGVFDVVSGIAHHCERRVLPTWNLDQNQK
jgi:hypothetical protein